MNSKTILTNFLAISLMTIGVQAQTLNTLSEPERTAGFTLLFDGTIESFQTNFADYMKNDSMTNTLSPNWVALDGWVGNSTNTPDIRSIKQYQDFDLRFDYLAAGDAGAYYRMNLQGDRPWQTAAEFSILDNPMGLCKDCVGSAFSIFAPTVDVYQPFATGNWNSVRIVVVGDSVEHWLNGVQVVGYKYHTPEFWSAYDASKWSAELLYTMAVPGSRDSGYIRQGYIGFQGTHSIWSMTNLRINDQAPKLGADVNWVSISSKNRHKQLRATIRPRLIQGGLVFGKDGSKGVNLKGRVVNLKSIKPALLKN